MSSSIYKGKRYYINDPGYFVRDERSNGKRKMILMHRKIWEDNFGPIPKGASIHHKDEDRTNNDIDNLECLK